MREAGTCRQRDATARLLDATGTRQVGLVIYNAGGDPFISQFLNTDGEQWMKLLRMNTQTVMDISHAFGGRMIERGRGGLLLVGSHAALRWCAQAWDVFRNQGLFAKSGVNRLWAEWKDRGVDVLNLLISTVDTPMMRETMQRLNIPNAMTMPLPQADEHRLPGSAATAGTGPTLHSSRRSCGSGGRSVTRQPETRSRDKQKVPRRPQFIGND